MAFFSTIGFAVGVAATATTTAFIVGVIVVVAVIAVVGAIVMAVMSGGVAGGEAPEAQKNRGVRQRIPTDPSNKLSIVYGNRRTAGTITYADMSPNNRFMYFIVALSEGPCENIGKVYYGDQLMFFPGQGDFDKDDRQGSIDGNIGLAGTEGSIQEPTAVVAENGFGDDIKDLVGNIQFRAYPQGGRCAEMESNSSKWRNNAKNRTMPDTAYVYIRLRYDRKAQVTGLSDRIGFYLEGKKMRTFSPTGVLNNDLVYSRNPAEILTDYLLNPIYGCGLLEEDLDLKAMYDHKRFCGEIIPHFDTDGVTEINAPRYEINGVINTAADLDKNIADICLNSNGWFTYNLGKFGVVSDKSGRARASDLVDDGDAKDGIILGGTYIITDIGAGGSFSSFGASAFPEVGEVFTSTRNSEVSDASFTGEAEKIKRVYSEEEMYGAINISSGGFDSIINRMTVTFPSDEQGQQEVDQVIIDTRVTPAAGVPNPYYIDPSLVGSLANPDEPLLEQTLNMHLTRGNIQAERIAAVGVNNSRQNISVDFKVDLSSLDLRGGDLIAVRHSTPGWGYDTANFDLLDLKKSAPKVFRVSSIEEEATGDKIALTISATEYNSDNYEDRTIQKRDTAPNTGFVNRNRTPDIGSATVRYKIQEYSFDSTNLDSIDVTMKSGSELLPSQGVIGRKYRITSVGDTLQESWNTIAGTTGITYSLNSTLTFTSFATVTYEVSETIKGKDYQITSLGSTSQANWNILAGTSAANYVVGSTFRSVETGTAGLGSGTITTSAGDALMVEVDNILITLPGSPGEERESQDVASAMATGLRTDALIVDSAVAPGIPDTVLVEFSSRLGDGTLTGAEMSPGQVYTEFDNASLFLEDAGVSSIRSGIPHSALSVNYKDDDPFLDRIDIRSFLSNDPNISMDPSDVNYIGNDLFNGVRGKKLIGNFVATNDSPFELSSLQPQSSYQVDVRSISTLGRKGPWIRLATGETESLASLYTATLTNKSANVPSNSGSGISSFSVGGEFQVFITGGARVTSNIFYSISSLERVIASDATIDNTGVYTVTGVDPAGRDPGVVGITASISDGNNVVISSGNTLSSGNRYLISSIGDTTDINWVAAGFPAGITPEVGIPFTLTGSSVGTGKVSKVLVEITRYFYLEKVIDSTDLIAISIIHELEEDSGTNIYRPAPAFFRDNREFLGGSTLYQTGGVEASHLYTITSIGGATPTAGQLVWNTLAGTTGVTYLVGDSFVAVVDGDGGVSASSGLATTEERNYRLRAVVTVGSAADPSESTYTYTWFRKKFGVPEETLLTGVGETEGLTCSYMSHTC